MFSINYSVHMGSIIGSMAEVASIIRGPARPQANVYPVWSCTLPEY